VRSLPPTFVTSTTICNTSTSTRSDPPPPSPSHTPFPHCLCRRHRRLGPCGWHQPPAGGPTSLRGRTGPPTVSPLPSSPGL
jgi:hypothetical protein